MPIPLKCWLSNEHAEKLGPELSFIADKSKQTTYQNKPDSKSTFKPLQISVHAL